MTLYRKINEYLDSKENREFNKLIDYTKISENLTNDQIKEICKEAIDNNFYSVCILPQYIAAAHSFLKNDVKISASIDFPKGESDVKSKISKINNSIINGANDIDIVINYKLIKDSEEHETLEKEIRELSEYCHREGNIIKVIIEIGALNYQEIESICKMCIDSNVDFVMTSTGKLPNDDTFETKLNKVKFMRKILPDEIKIKFSGGIRTKEQIKELLPFVDRIGTSIIISK
jgi:deoxyribose-phosphate aldolase